MLLEICRCRVVRFGERRPERERVGLFAFGIPRRPLWISRRRHAAEIRQHRYRRVPMLERSGIDQRLEGRPRLTPASCRPVEGAARVAGTANHRENVAAGRIDRDKRCLETPAIEALQADRHSALGGLLKIGPERRMDLPVRGVIASKLSLKLLSQECLGPSGAGVRRLTKWLYLRPRGRCSRLLRWREDVFDDYDIAGFEKALQERFDIRERSVIPGSERVLYRAKRR